jgi:hypothetical protein
MAFQVYLVVCREECGIDGVKEVVGALRAIGALVLLATKQLTIVAGFDESHLPRVRILHNVTFVGGVTLDPRGVAVRELESAFTEHLTRQLGAPGDIC